jgi:hypothetical protein
MTAGAPSVERKKKIKTKPATKILGRSRLTRVILSSESLSKKRRHNAHIRRTILFSDENINVLLLLLKRPVFSQGNTNNNDNNNNNDAAPAASSGVQWGGREDIILYTRFRGYIDVMYYKCMYDLY